MNAKQLTSFIKTCSATAYQEPHSELIEQITREVVSMLSQKVSIGKESLILDIGCGTGYAATLLSECGACVDCSTVLPAEESAIRALGNSRLDVFVEDMHDLSASDMYDGVFARHVLEHSPMPFFVLQKIHTALKKDGWIYMEVPSPGTSSRHETNPNHWSVMGPDMWSQLLLRAGFKVQDTFQINFETLAGQDSYLVFVAKK